MNTPKSQNPEGKVVEPVAWMDSYGGIITAAMKKQIQGGIPDGYRIPLIPATTLTDVQRELDSVRRMYCTLETQYNAMQRRLEAVEALPDLWEAFANEHGIAVSAAYMACAKRLRATLRDGKGDGVSTAEGEGK